MAVDGSKIKANASKHKAMSYGRMQETERELEAEIGRILAEAETLDNQEDGKFGKGRRGDELPKELQGREERLKKIREAKQRLEERARADAAERAREVEQKTAERRQREAETGHKAGGREANAPNPQEARPDAKAQSNFTDPESRIMKDGATKEFTQAYNAQIAVDGTCGVIVGTLVTQAANDSEQLAPTVASVVENCGKAPDKVSADAGYCSDAALSHTALEGVDLYVATGRERKATASGVETTEPQLQQHSLRRRNAFQLATLSLALSLHAALSAALSPTGYGVPASPLVVRTARQHMRQKLQTEAGKAIYARRKALVEAPFGSIKEVQRMRRFSVRGFNKVQGEWNLATACHNLLKVFRHGTHGCQCHRTKERTDKGGPDRTTGAHVAPARRP